MPRKTPRYMQPKKEPIDRSRLGEEWHKSLSLPEFYVDHTFHCVGCGMKQIFTAKAQKECYEEHGRPPWHWPTRCERCQSEWHSLRNSIRQFPELLRGEPTLDQLREMQESMERFQSLGGRHDVALYNRIQRILQQASGE